MKTIEMQSVKSKRLSSISILMVGITLVTIVAVFFINVMNQSKLREQSELIIYAHQLKAGSQLLTAEVRGYASTGDQVHYDNYWREVNETKSRDDAIANMKRIGITKEEEAQIENIGNQSNQLIPLEEQVMELVGTGDLANAVSIIYGDEYQSGIDQIYADTQDFIQGLDGRVSREARMGEILGLIVAVISFTALIYTILLQIKYMRFVRLELVTPITAIKDQMSYIAKGNLSEPFMLEGNESEVGMLITSIHETKECLKSIIDEAASALEKMASKDYGIEIGTEFIGEFSRMKESLLSILNNMNDAFHSIRQASTEVAENSSQMSQVSQDLAESSVNQTATVEEMGKAMEEITRAGKETSEKAVRSSELIHMANESLTESSNKMHRMKEAIYKIRESADRINGITQTISEIANQTNLLALNASIEAARAGEAGKGFAVVADEVKNLANESAEAVKDTDELIRNVIASVMDGDTLADEMVASLNEVREQEKSTSDMMEELTRTADDQLRIIEQVADGMAQMSDAAESLSATAEETAAASAEQQRQASNLEDLLNGFRLR